MVWSLEEYRREQLIALVKRVTDTPIEYDEGPRNYAGGGQTGYLSLTALTHRGHDEVKITPAANPVPSEDLKRTYEGERLVTMNVRFECFDHTVIATQLAERLHNGFTCAGWRELLSALGLVVVTRFPIQETARGYDNAQRSSAVASYRLRYTAAHEDPFRITWIQYVEGVGVIQPGDVEVPFQLEFPV